MSEKQAVTAPLLCDLTKELGERFFHRLCVGAKRDVLMLSTAKRPTWKGPRLKGTAQFRVHHWHAGSLREIELPETSQTFFYFQRLGEDYLCVAARCAPDESNAHVFDAQGQLLRSWHMGDGIADVQVAPNEKIWVSYFDEGVFAMKSDFYGTQGLICLDKQGAPLFGFRNDCPAMPEECDGMADCYALNVASNRDTWLFYYTQFPLVHLRDLAFKQYFAPPPEMIGSHAFAVCDWRRLFVGGYHFKDKLFWRDEASKRQVEIEAVDEQGAPVTWKRCVGRGADLFLIDDARVRMLSLNEVGF